MSIKCKLASFLQHETQIDFAKRTGISRQTIQKLYTNQSSGIQFETLDKICQGLGITVGDLLLSEYTPIEDIFRNASEINVVLGARLVQLVDGSGAVVYGVGPQDVEALSFITEMMYRYSPQRKIKRYWMPEFPEWELEQNSQSLADDTYFDKAQSLLKNTHGVLFIVGSDRTNGLAHYALDQILNVGYNPHGKGRKPIRLDLPYKIALPYAENKSRIMALDQKAHNSRGIVSMKTKQLMVAVPAQKEIDTETFGNKLTDGAIVYIDPPNFHHKYCTILGIAGITGMGTSLTTKHLFNKKNLRVIDKQLRESRETSKPAFLVAQVKYLKSGTTDSMEFILE